MIWTDEAVKEVAIRWKTQRGATDLLNDERAGRFGYQARFIGESWAYQGV